ncbi:MAG: PAS domain S-box protein [Phycisphaerae bacterium]|nr:PAS domain S-box protein [Phycisphaerae bacterium]
MNLSDFFRQQLDYISFIEGLALLLLGFSCLRARQVDPKLPWGWLAGFGILSGLSRWLQFVNLSIGSQAILFVGDTIELLGVAFLLQFTCCYALKNSKPFFKNWTSLIVLIVVISSLVVGIILEKAYHSSQGVATSSDGVEEIFHHVFGFAPSIVAMVTSLWAAWALRKEKTRMSRLADIIAVSLVLYAVFEFFSMMNPSWISRLFKGHVQWEFVQFASHSLSGILAAVIGVTLWKWSIIVSRDQHVVSEFSETGIWTFASIMGAVLLVGWVTVILVGSYTESNMKSALLTQTRVVGAAIDAAVVRRLHGRSDDIGKPDYEALKRRLKRLKDADQKCRFVYLMMRQGDRVVFLVDSEPSNSPDCSPAGQVYEEATDGVRSLFDRGVDYIEGPFADRWGVWVSGMVSVIDTENHQTVAVLGMDLKANDWSQGLYLARLPMIGVILLICVLLTGFWLVQEKSQKDAARVAASEDSYRSLVEGSPNCIILLDEKGCFVTINQNGLTKMGLTGMGLTGMDFYGKPFLNIWPTTSRASIEAILREAAYGTQQQCTADYERPDGRKMVWQVAINPLESGRGRYAVICTDMTATKRAEKAKIDSENRLKLIFDTIPTGLFLIDAENKVIVEANPAALKMIGAPLEKVIGQTCSTFLHLVAVRGCPILDHGQTCDNSEHQLIRADGELLPILKTVIPIMLDGRMHMVESFIDITERKRAEVELAAHRTRLEELVSQRSQQLVDVERQVLQAEKLASVGRLAAGVAHEINTPIQFIGDNLHALSDFFKDLNRLVDQYRELAQLVSSAKEGPEGEGGAVSKEIEAIRSTEEDVGLPFILEDAPKAIAQGLDGVNRVANIVRAMRDFSHVKTSESTIVNINRCLESTVTVARNEYKYVADVEMKLEEELPLIECYPSELNQVFLNLLVNAAHAIQERGEGYRGVITIATRSLEMAVEVAITDTGMGIPEEIRNKIYDLFFTTKPVGKGTGQGLYLAYRTIVEKHGGTIQCDSTVGVGTTFRIQLPMQLPKSTNGGLRPHE